MSTDRAILFIDGNNWYHSLKDAGVGSLSQISYAKISRKLVGPARSWIETRYYIGALKHYHRDQPNQRRFVAGIQNEDSRITLHFGRIEDQPKPNALSPEVLEFLRRNPQLPLQLRDELREMAERHRFVSLLKEKATDVLLAIDLCKMAVSNGYEAAYLLSADGDYTPAVEFAKGLGKRVYAASPADCAALRNSASAYIPLAAAWFGDCYK